MMCCGDFPSRATLFVTTDRPLSGEDSAADTPIVSLRKPAPCSQRLATPAGGVDDCIENTHQKWSVCGFDACARLKPRFSQGERTRQPRNQLDDDGVDKRGDVQRPQKGAAARHSPAQQHPDAPQQVQEQNGSRENGCYKNGRTTSLCWPPAINYPLTLVLGVMRCADTSSDA
jgi:hypothetical protein